MAPPRAALAFALILVASHNALLSAQIDANQADRVLVEKAARRMTLLDDRGRVIRTYSHVQLGQEPIGPKRFEGDQRTPEGRYVIDYGNRASEYHLSLHISYPAPRDIETARAAGRPAGGQIFIHGQPNEFQRLRIDGDWTDGCIALTNQEIEEFWALVGDGTPIDIRP